MPSFLRTQVPLGIASFLTIYMLLEYFVDLSVLRSIGGDIRTWAVVIATFSIGLGIVAVTLANLRDVRRRAKNWPLSLWCIVIMLIMIGTGFIGPLATHPIFLWLYQNALSSLSGSIYSILAFFITTAAYRAFRARNIDAALVLIPGIFVILSSAPIGAVIWGGIPIIGNWFVEVPNMAGMRGILIGIGVGAITLGLRTILGLEKMHLGGQE